jgi:hypothetical protein
MLVMASGALAAPFRYVNGDLLACFRTEGGESDLVVNLGSVSRFESLPWGTSVPLGEVDGLRLASAFPSLAALRWSVLAAHRGNTNLTQHPIQTLWISSPHPEPETPGIVWKRRSSFTQGTAASQVEAIGLGALTYGNQVPAGPANTNNAIVIPSQDPNAYSVLISSEGNLSGTFPGTVEALAPDPFEATASEASLIRLVPGSGTVLNSPGSVIGLFRLAPDGSLLFSAGPPLPRILNVERSGDTTRVQFSTTPGFSYRLRYTEPVTLEGPPTSWSFDPTTVLGSGQPATLDHPDSRNALFFVVEALP